MFVLTVMITCLARFLLGSNFCFPIIHCVLIHQTVPGPVDNQL